MSESITPPLLGFVAFSGTGKTTLLQQLIPELNGLGLRCAVIKHSHHDFEIDVPGKDSHRLRTAGAAQVLLASAFRTFWVAEGDGVSEPRLADQVRRLDPAGLDLVLVEGFRHERLPKIEVYRPQRGLPLLCLEDPDVIAVATDGEVAGSVALPLLPLNDAAAVARFVADWLHKQSSAA